MAPVLNPVNPGTDSCSSPLIESESGVWWRPASKLSILRRGRTLTYTPASPALSWFTRPRPNFAPPTARSLDRSEATPPPARMATVLPAVIQCRCDATHLLYLSSSSILLSAVQPFCCSVHPPSNRNNTGASLPAVLLPTAPALDAIMACCLHALRPPISSPSFPLLVSAPSTPHFTHPTTQIVPFSDQAITQL